MILQPENVVIYLMDPPAHLSQDRGLGVLSPSQAQRSQHQVLGEWKGHSHDALGLESPQVVCKNQP